MRLRSSRFVFLLLLACTVQVGEACALRLITAQSLQDASVLRVALPSQTPGPRIDADVSRPARRFRLDSRSIFVERVPWSMAQPAMASAATLSYTGLLRA